MALSSCVYTRQDTNSCAAPARCWMKCRMAAHTNQRASRQTHTYTHIHTYIHTYINTYMHTYIHPLDQTRSTTFLSRSKCASGRRIHARMLKCRDGNHPNVLQTFLVVAMRTRVHRCGARMARRNSHGMLASIRINRCRARKAVCHAAARSSNVLGAV